MTVRKDFERAVTAHRAAVGHWHAAGSRQSGVAASLTDRQRRLITQLAQAATVVTPGWLGQALTRARADAPLGESDPESPLAVRIGECVPDADHRFPVIVNLLGTGHLALDAPASRPQVASVLRSVPLRLLAHRPADSLDVTLVDPSGSVFTDFAPLWAAGYCPAPVTDAAGFVSMLDTAEAQLDRAARTGDTQDLPERLLVVAAVPTGCGDVTARLARIAAAGPAARLHLVMADCRTDRLDHTTYVSVDTQCRVAGVPFPVAMDQAPEPELVTAVCSRIAAAGRWLIGGLET